MSATPITPGGVQHSSQVIPEAAREIIARLDRLKVWSLSPGLIAIVGLGFLFTFYDIFDINVSFIETCTALVKGCTPETALNSLAIPVILNLVGYVVGTLVLSPIADRVGRRNMLLVTMLLTGLGSLYTALSPDLANFDISRIITGMGIGADLAIVNTYISEVSPRQARARFVTVIFIMSALGAFLGIWLGLLLTTPAAPWPTGLPFALAGAAFPDGWRWMYGIGALLALVAILLRFRLPESARWLLSRNRISEADEVVTAMEARAQKRGPLDAPDVSAVPTTSPVATKIPFADVFTNPIYLRRVLLLFVMWFIAYITVYGYATGFTTVLVSLKYSPPEAGVITAVGTIGFVAEAIIMSFVVEKLERRYWLIIGAVVTLVGAFIVAAAGTNVGLSFVGAMFIFAGFNLWVSPTYTLTAESFPTRARTTGFALVDGVGHVGGGIGILVIAPIIPSLSVLGALLLISSFLVVAAILVQFTRHTRNRSLDEVSP